MPAYGDLVIIVTPKGKRSLRRVDENQDMHTQDGILRMADVVEAPFGSEVCTTLGVPYRIQKPTLNDIVKGVKRQTQILYPKDIGYICMRLGVGPNRTVIEAGTGSGSLPWPCRGSPARPERCTRSRPGRNSTSSPGGTWSGRGWGRT